MKRPRAAPSSAKPKPKPKPKPQTQDHHHHHPHPTRPSKTPSPRSSTQQLPQKLPYRSPSTKPQRPESQHPLPYRHKPPFSTPTPSQYKGNGGNVFKQWHLPARYKWSCALKRTPDILRAAFVGGAVSRLKQLFHLVPAEKSSVPERTAIGRFVFKSLMNHDRSLLRAINVATGTWGRLAENKGSSNYPTLTGDREIIYESFAALRGRTVRPGELITCYHPSDPNKMLCKRVRSIEGEVFSQKAASWGTFIVQVPRAHCYVLGDNTKGSKDSRSIGAIPIASVRGKVIWRWGVDGFHWIDHDKQPWLEGTSSKRRTLVPARTPIREAPKAKNPIPDVETSALSDLIIDID